MRSLLFGVLLLQASCRQACGLDLIADTGGGGSGASGPGGSGAAGAAGGGGSSAGGTGGANGGGGSGGAIGGSGGSGAGGCTMPDSLDPEPVMCLEPAKDHCEEFTNAHTLSDDSPATLMGEETLGAGLLTLSNGGGFFTGGPNALFLHFPNVNGSFFVSTLVRPRGGAGAWPNHQFRLGGLVVRDAACTTSNCGRWIKAEAGTLNPAAEGAPIRRGIRVAEHDSSNVMDVPATHDEVEPGWLDYCDAPWVQISICAVDNGANFDVETWYRELGDTTGDWNQVGPDFQLPVGTLDVGIVGAGTDIAADFAYLQMIPIPGGDACDSLRVSSSVAVEPP